MKPIKYSAEQANKIDLGTKIIYKYPTPTKEFDIAKMVIDGRNPEGEDKFILEHECSFVIYITNGSGKIYLENETFEVLVGDVVFIPKENKFAMEGKFEYITVDVPAFYPEQAEEVTYAGT